MSIMRKTSRNTREIRRNTSIKLTSSQAHKLISLTKIIQTVFVGLSGGVDSSVAAYLLKKQGYNVVGAFIKVWQPDFVECNWKEDRRSAMRVAAHLDIPFVTIDLSKEYKREVVDYMIREYKKGRTPNPDVMCNKEIKFKAFLNQALKMGADMIATGHYARVESGKWKVESGNSKGNRPPSTVYSLLKAKDKAKEQSYFLWTLTQKQLSKTLFPIGNLQKSEVRSIAKKAGLHTFERKDSQGLCFIGKVDFKDFLRRFIKEKKGNVLDTEGKVIGHHNGATFLTIGERHGFTITKKGTNDKPMYVVLKNVSKNTVIVSESQKVLFNTMVQNSTFLENINWINGDPKRSKIYNAQVRYHQEHQKCKIELFSQGLTSGIGCLRSDLKEVEKKSLARVIFENPQIATPGQSIVIYDKDVCMGGGVIL